MSKAKTTWAHSRHPLIEAEVRRDLGVVVAPHIRGTLFETRDAAADFRNGLSIRGIADQYETLTSFIEAALRFELDQSAKRDWRKWYREVSR